MLIPESLSWFKQSLAGYQEIRDRLTLREGRLFISKGKHLKMEPCVQSKSRARSPYDYVKETEKLKQIAPEFVWEKALKIFHKKRVHRRPRRPSTTTCEPRLSGGLRAGFEPAAKTCGSLWGTVSSWSPTAKRMTKFEPASKSRGSQGGCPVEPESRLLRGSCEISPETASEMLRTRNQLLQVVLQLLQ